MLKLLFLRALQDYGKESHIVIYPFNPSTQAWVVLAGFGVAFLLLFLFSHVGFKLDAGLGTR